MARAQDPTQITGSCRSAGTDAIRAARTSLMSIALTAVPPGGRREAVRIITMQNGQRGGDRLGAGREHLARPVLVDPRAAGLLHPHAAAAGAAAERVLAATSPSR